MFCLNFGFSCPRKKCQFLQWASNKIFRNYLVPINDEINQNVLVREKTISFFPKRTSFQFHKINHSEELSKSFNSLLKASKDVKRANISAGRLNQKLPNFWTFSFIILFLWSESCFLHWHTNLYGQKRWVMQLRDIKWSFSFRFTLVFGQKSTFKHLASNQLEFLDTINFINVFIKVYCFCSEQFPDVKLLRLNLAPN